MFEYTRKAIASRFDHPVLGLMLLISAAMAAAGLVVQTLIETGMSDWNLGAGFFAVFSLFFAIVGGIGYGLLFLAKLVSITRDRVGPAS